MSEKKGYVERQISALLDSIDLKNQELEKGNLERDSLKQEIANLKEELDAVLGKMDTIDGEPPKPKPIPVARDDPARTRDDDF